MASFSWKAALVSPWWCHSKKFNFSFVFTTTNGQEGFPCFWFVEVAYFSTLFPNLEECRWDLNNFFSHCVLLTACLCLHEAARFMTFKAVRSPNSLWSQLGTLARNGLKNAQICWLSNFSLKYESPARHYERGILKLRNIKEGALCDSN